MTKIGSIMKSLKNISSTNLESDHGIYIHWELTKKCNYSCIYCSATDISKKDSFQTVKIDISRILEKIEKIDDIILFTFTGGEPFLISNFPEFIKEITRKHLVRIDTNLSIKQNCEKFLNIVNPSKIYEIIFSTHILELKKKNINLEDLCKTVNKFQDKGFKITGNYVLWPPLINNFEKDLDFFRQKGISVFPSLFIGNYQQKEYPFSYTEDDLQRIRKYNPESLSVLSRSYGKKCTAGTRAFYINSNFDVFPCFSYKKRIGNLLNKIKPLKKIAKCPSEYCYCPFNRYYSFINKYIKTRIHASCKKE